jgi:hypothetical protein
MNRCAIALLVIVLCACGWTHVHAQTVSLWRAGNGIGLDPDGDGAVTASQLLFGHLPSPTQAPSEVAVAQAVIRRGEVVPLPVYGDGTQAREGEVFWTATVWRATFSGGCIAWPYYSGGDACTVTFSGRTLTTTDGSINNLINCDNRYGWPLVDMQVLVTVVAMRSNLPTADRRGSWGALKVTYR